MLKICFVSDYFCPNTGGVESHIYHLAQCMMSIGHEVVVVTHTYGRRKGIRILTNGVKVYYLPFVVFHEQNVLPTFFVTLPAAWYIINYESVDLVHVHSSVSTMAQEFMFHAKLLGIRTVFTDHSLFGFSDLASIACNKMLQCSLVYCDSVICVSHTSKENTVLRAHLPPNRVYVIPNAINANEFMPDPEGNESNDRLTIIVAGRMVYRKGIDLLGCVIPIICKRYDFVDFVVAGDGPKRLVLEETRERCRLQGRVHLVGNIPHDRMEKVLRCGRILLNTSLTEAFCTTLLEAASCGLHIVATNVGGVPEVLPSDLITLTKPTVQGIVDALSDVIDKCVQHRIPGAHDVHRRVEQMYSWRDVALRTQTVYLNVLRCPVDSPCDIFCRHIRSGLLFGMLMCIATVIELAVLHVVDSLSLLFLFRRLLPRTR